MSACRAEGGGFDSRRGRQTPGSSNGRTRGSEPRDGGSSPSPGANHPTWPSGKAAARNTATDRVRFPGSGPPAGVAQTAASPAGPEPARGPLRRLAYTQEVAGSSPCLGNHTLVAELVGIRLLPGTIEVRVLARVPNKGIAQPGPRRVT